MSYNPLRSYEFVQQTVRSHTDTRDAMTRLIDHCEASCPSQVWNEILGLDFAADISYLQAWLRGVLSDEPPPDNTKAFWFGLFNPVVTGETTCDVYISGSAQYDPADNTCNWACWTADSYLPNGRYAESRVLHEIYHLVQASGRSVFPRSCRERSLCSGGERCWLGEYVLCLGYACISIGQALEAIDLALLLGKAQTRPVVVGYDSGDSILIGQIDRNGWQPSTNK